MSGLQAQLQSTISQIRSKTQENMIIQVEIEEEN